MDSQWTHNGLTMDSQRTHNGLTMDSQWTHNGLTMDSQRTHKGFTKDSHKIHTKIIEKALVLLGCPRKMLFLHWFCKVVREKCCFYIGFARVVRESPCKTCVKTTFLADNPGTIWTRRRRSSRTHPGLTTALASASNRLSLAHTASPRLARSHARTKRNDFPVGLTPPTSNPNFFSLVADFYKF